PLLRPRLRAHRPLPCAPPHHRSCEGEWCMTPGLPSTSPSSTSQAPTGRASTRLASTGGRPVPDRGLGTVRPATPNRRTWVACAHVQALGLGVARHARSLSGVKPLDQGRCRPVTTANPAREDERRRVILFVDMVGSTELKYRLGPDVVFQMM